MQEAEVFMRQILTAVIVILTVGYDAASAANSAVQSPIGSPTAVPSARQNSLIPSQPSTYGVSGNMVMTGNVGGGKQFRGVVPYGSSFYNSSSSGPIDNFLRRSAGDPLATDRNPGVYTPYYDPRRTVTSVYRGGQTGLVAPQVSPQGRANASIPSGLPQTKNTPFGPQQRPLSTSPEDVSQILDRQIMMDQTVNPIKTRKDINTLSKETKKKGDQDALSPEGMLLPEQVLKPIEGMQDKKETTREVVPDRFKQVRDKIIEETKRQEMDDAENKTAKTKEEIPGETTDIQTQESALDGRYTTFADLADAKASEYMTAAQEFLKEGKYYKAADSFALAAVWKPQDAQTWIGQVGSLFAAGEYMSSAYYLGQVLALKPELIEQKIPSAILMQNRDIFENGIIETAAWQERSQSGELAFLMAYMLWQDGKVVRAQDAIARAQTLIPESEAIKTLVGIINSSVPAQKPAAGAGTAKEPNSLSAQVTVPKTIFREPNQP
jgi:hypothetical protein